MLSNTHSNLQNILPNAVITYIKFITRRKLETSNPGTVTPCIKYTHFYFAGVTVVHHHIPLDLSHLLNVKIDLLIGQTQSSCNSTLSRLHYAHNSYSVGQEVHSFQEPRVFSSKSNQVVTATSHRISSSLFTNCPTIC